MSKLLEAALGDDLFEDKANEFARTHTRRADPATSYKAAVSISYRAGSHSATILEAMRGRPPMQYEEIANLCGIEGHAVARRLPDMQRDGRVLASMDTRPLSSGSAGRLWRLTVKA